MDKLITLNGAEILYSETVKNLKETNENVAGLDLRKCDGARVEDEKYLYLTSNGTDIAGPFGPFSGGGGGGGGSSAVITLTNLTGWQSTTISAGTSCSIKFTWSSLEEGVSTGNGTLNIKVNGSVRKTANIEQGIVEEDITDYLTTGSNTVYVSVTDIYGSTKPIIYTVSVVALTLTSSFDSSLTYTGPISFPYIPTGTGDKTVYFIVDEGKESEATYTSTITTSGRQVTQVIPEQDHGSHTLRVYFTTVISEVVTKSPELYYDIICLEDGVDTPVITSDFRGEVEQYVTSSLNYYIYDPTTQVAEEVKLYQDDKVTTLTNVSRVQHAWSFTFETSGAHTLKILYNGVEKVFNLDVKASSITPKPVTDSLRLYLTSKGRSNSEPEEERSKWEYTGYDGTTITSTLSNFNWSSDGWISDELTEGYPALRVKGNARVTINYQPFKLPSASEQSKSIQAVGRTIEVEFATSSVSNYDDPIISCFSDNVGFNITAQQALYKTSQTSLSTPYKENEHIRVSFVINSENNGTADRFIYCFVNGINSGLARYATQGEDLTQNNPVNITIGSDDVVTDIYNIRVYDRYLTHYEVVDNWIADTQNGAQMVERYHHNDVFDESTNKITIEKIEALKDLPYFVFEGATLPTSKDEIKLSGYFVNPSDSTKNFTFTSAPVACQGTSSMEYPIKNFKVKLKKAATWLDYKGNDLISTGYQMNSSAVPTKTFVFKADYASSEGANNVELVRYYNDICTYKTPPQQGDTGTQKHRQGIDGFPMVVFQKNGNEINFIGKYNFNNDKGTDEVYGFSTNSSTKYDYSNTDQSWEMTDNNNEVTRWKRPGSSLDDLLGSSGGFEVRYPADWQDWWDDRTEHPEYLQYIDASKLIEVQTWVSSTDPKQADPTKELDSPVTYAGVTYTHDTKEYRLAKFRAEFENYFNLEDAVFYYIYTEFFLMIDSRVKNAFPTRFNSDEKWIWFPYDMDTAIGINNEGQYAYSYDREDTDMISETAGVFNGYDSVIWNNLRDCFSDTIKTKYKALRADGDDTESSTGLSYDKIEKRYEEHQNKWSEAIFNEDSYFKYVSPAQSGSYTKGIPMCLGSKAEQRKWWLYNRVRYLDSKYEASLSSSKSIAVRAWGVEGEEIGVTPYYDIYVKVKIGNSGNYFKRGSKNVESIVPITLTQTGDTEVYIYSADQIKSVRNLSMLKPNSADFSAAINLQSMDLSNTEDNPNPNLTELGLGANTLLKTIDVSYCTNLAQSIEAGQCVSLRKAIFKGTKIPGITLPEGGVLEQIVLPDTITSLTLKNQKNITELTIDNLDTKTNVGMLDIEYANELTWNVALQILNKMAANSGVRLVDFNYTFATADEFKSFITFLNTMMGIDTSGHKTDTAVVIGTATITSGSLTYEYLKSVNDKYGTQFKIVADIVKTIKFYSHSGELLETKEVTSKTGVETTATFTKTAPTKDETDTIYYDWAGWVDQNGNRYDDEATEGKHRLIKGITTDLTLTAYYDELELYTVTLYNYDGTTTLCDPIKTINGRVVSKYPNPNKVIYEGGAPEAPEEYSAPWNGWSTTPYGSLDVEFSEDFRTISGITSDKTFYASMDWQVKSMSVTTSADKVLYYEGDVFNEDGMVITSIKDTPQGDTPAVITVYDIDKTPVTKEQTSVTISLTTTKGLVTTYHQIGVAQNLEITKRPTKKFWLTKHKLDFSGMELTITFSNETELKKYKGDEFEAKEIITEGWTLDPDEFGEETTEGYHDVVVQYKNLSYLESTISVLIVRYVSNVLNENSWTVISAVASEGIAEQYWSIGDEHSIHIVNDYEHGIPYDPRDSRTVRILAFDHNMEQESPGVHTITFGYARAIPVQTPSGSEEYMDVSMGVSLTDGSRTLGFGENQYDYTWNRNSYFRKACNEYIYNCMDEDLRNVIKTVYKGQSDEQWTSDKPPVAAYDWFFSDANCQQYDKIFIPSYCELTGIGKINTAQTSDETTVCKQFEYYKNHCLDSDYQKNKDTYMARDGQGNLVYLHWFTRSFYAEEAFWTSTTTYTIQYRYIYCSIDGKFSASNSAGVATANNGLMFCFNV